MTTDELDLRVKSLVGEDPDFGLGLTPSDYKVSIDNALLEFSASYPCKQKSTLKTTADSMDISLSTLTNRIDIEGVEYPTGESPRSLVPFEEYGDILTMLLDSAPSAAEDAYIYWGTKHTATSLPVQYEPLVLQGATGYALGMLSMRKRHEGVLKIGTALTELAKMIAGGATNLAAAVTAIDTARTELAKMITGGVGELSDADAALDSAKGEIAKIITGGVGELTDADTALDRVHQWLDTDSASAKAALAKIATYLTGGSVPSAAEYLKAGDDLINEVNDGSDAAGHYAQFAAGAHSISSGFSQEATQRMNMATAYISEAIQRLGVKGMYAREALQYINEATGRLQVKGMYQREAATSLNEATARLNVLTTYAREARTYLDASAALNGAAERYQKQADTCLAQYRAELAVVKRSRPSMPRPVFHFKWG